MALTFSTLLSSQGSGSPRRPPGRPAGNSQTVRPTPPPGQPPTRPPGRGATTDSTPSVLTRPTLQTAVARRGSAPGSTAASTRRRWGAAATGRHRETRRLPPAAGQLPSPRTTTVNAGAVAERVLRPRGAYRTGPSQPQRRRGERAGPVCWSVHRPPTPHRYTGTALAAATATRRPRDSGGPGAAAPRRLATSSSSGRRRQPPAWLGHTCAHGPGARLPRTRRDHLPEERAAEPLAEQGRPVRLRLRVDAACRRPLRADATEGANGCRSSAAQGIEFGRRRLH